MCLSDILQVNQNSQVLLLHLHFSIAELQQYPLNQYMLCCNATVCHTTIWPEIKNFKMKKSLLQQGFCL